MSKGRGLPNPCICYQAYTYISIKFSVNGVHNVYAVFAGAGNRTGVLLRGVRMLNQLSYLGLIQARDKTETNNGEYTLNTLECILIQCSLKKVIVWIMIYIVFFPCNGKQ